MNTSANSAKPILSVRGLHKWYGDVHIIKGVDLDVQPGEVVVIIGPSGGGKSTFLRCLNFLETFSAGSVEVAGIRVDAAGSKDEWQRDIREIRRQAAMVFQDFNLFPHMSILDNVIQGATAVKKVSKARAIAQAEALLDEIGLLARRDDLPRRLSVGEQQQVAIARSLCMEPQILLFDDPTSALDPVLVHDLAATIRRLAAAGIAGIVVTNEPYLARSVADRVILLDGGTWAEIAPPDEFFTNPQQARTRQFLERIDLKDVSVGG